MVGNGRFGTNKGKSFSIHKLSSEYAICHSLTNVFLHYFYFFVRKCFDKKCPQLYLFSFNNHFPFFFVVVVVVFFFLSRFCFFFSLIRTFVRARSSRWSIFLHLAFIRIEVPYNRFML